jgi:hypothetical protein
LYNSEKNSFSPLTYAVDLEPKPVIGDFQKSRGITTASELSRLQQHYGDNTFDIPVPIIIQHPESNTEDLKNEEWRHSMLLEELGKGWHRNIKSIIAIVLLKP